MDGDGHIDFDEDKRPVRAVGFDFDGVEEHLDGPTNAGTGKTLVQRIREVPDDRLAPMLLSALEEAREQGREQGRKERQQERQTIQDEARRGMFRILLHGDPTPIQLWRKFNRLAFWHGALPGFDTQKKLAEKIGCTRSAIGQQLAKEIPHFTRETETPIVPSTCLPDS
jgi:hypothetical protein